jgi:dethiobiotin synthetase
VHAPLVVVTGTGTGIGKTSLATAFLRAWGRVRPKVLGYKPIESGVTEAGAEDGLALEAASTFHVKHLPHLHLRTPVSPHLAARREGVQVDAAVIAGGVATARAEADGVVLELPGGLFSPLADDLLAVDFVKRLSPTALVLVAPDRLGVLHDVLAALEGANAKGASPTHVLLNGVETTDASTGTNAEELRRFVTVPVLGPVARNPDAKHAREDDAAIVALVHAIEAAASR